MTTTTTTVGAAIAGVVRDQLAAGQPLAALDVPDPTTSVAERVAAGATYLDQHEPGWVDRIDLERLDLASSCRCVLGQLEIAHTGDTWVNYVDAIDRRDLDTTTAIHLGFERKRHLEDWEQSEYDQLTAAWRELIEARRAGAA